MLAASKAVSGGLLCWLAGSKAASGSASPWSDDSPPLHSPWPSVTEMGPYSPDKAVASCVAGNPNLASERVPKKKKAVCGEEYSLQGLAGGSQRAECLSQKGYGECVCQCV